MSFHLHVAATDEQAVAEATPQMEQYIQVFRESATAWSGRASRDYPGYAEVIRELDTLDMARILREQRAFVGSPDTVEGQIRHALEWFGDVEPSLSILWGNMPYPAAETSLRLFAAEVMPRFAEAVVLAGPPTAI
jgi:alkanesulfonate monooxygenase SsuD/methylene tetrahydromethanopterin reductase-like flavin-dependent oxidoreductase (luciferase family)